MQIEQKQNCFLMLYAQLIVYNKYSWLFSENSTHFWRGLFNTLIAYLKLKMSQIKYLIEARAYDIAGLAAHDFWVLRMRRVMFWVNCMDWQRILKMRYNQLVRLAIS